VAMRELIRRVGRVQRLAVFEAAGRLGSFTAAAAELGMTQPAVTRQIRSLEAAIHAELFRRTSNRSELTDAGRALHLRVSQGFASIEGALADLGHRAEVFVLACNPGLAQQWLMPRLEELQAVLGGKELRLWLFDQDAELERGVFDAAVQVGDGSFPNVESRLLFNESVFPVASPGFAKELGLRRTSRPKALLDAPLLHMDDGDRPWMSWSTWFTHHHLSLPRKPGRILFNNYPMVLQQALAGRGVALGWRYLVDDLINDGVLTQVGPEVTSNQGYFLTWPRGAQSATIRALMEWLLSQSR
jgi:LysR family transcriptional regulator, glycine cleavage system transcriptional activator